MKKSFFSLFIGIIVSGTALYFAFKNVPVAELWTFVGDVNYFWVGPAVLLVLLSFFLRSIRWRIILGADRQLGFWDAHHPLAIGFLLNCILPGRIGELARPALLFNRERIPFATGLATVVTERIFDIVILLFIFVLTLSMVQIDPGIDIVFGGYHLTRSTLITIGRGMGQLSLVLLGGIVLISIDRSRQWINRVITGSPKWLFFLPSDVQRLIENKICTRLITIIDHIALGFSLVKNPGQLIRCTGLTVLIWLIGGISYFIIGLGSPGISLSIVDMFIYMVIICFFIALPSVPGYWGLWEAGGMFGLALFGILPENAAGFTLMNHAIQLFPVMIIGFASAWITGVNIWQASYPEKSPVR